MGGITIVSSLTLGATYALIGVGFVILFRSTGVVSFAQGFFSVMGGLIFGSLANAGWGLWVSLIAATLITCVIGAATYLLAFARLAAAKPFVLSIASVGLGFGLEAIAVIIWGPNPIITPEYLSFVPLVHSSWFPLTPVDAFTIVSAAVIIIALMVWLRFTTIGLRMRAVADNANLSSALGINVVRISTLAWLLAAGTAGVAGIVLVLGTQPDPPTLLNLGLVAFPAILLGGMDSIGGVVIGGLIIGFVQSYVSVYWGAQYSDLAAYSILVAILLVRPQGIFGSKGMVRV